MPFRLFVIYVLIQWWVRYDSDGTGYIAQRFQTARNDQAAKEGGLWFAIGFAALKKGLAVDHCGALLCIGFSPSRRP